MSADTHVVQAGQLRVRTAKSGSERALVVTLGTPHDKPWWWRHLGSDKELCSLEYERLVFKGKRSQDISTLDLPRVMLLVLRRLISWRRNYDYIFTFECDLVGFCIAFWQSIFRWKKPKHVILQFIMREQQENWSSRLKYALMRFIFSSVYRVVVSSKPELEYYREVFRWPYQKLVFVPFHTTPEFLERGLPAEDDYIIAAGRSFRDYGTLADALRNTGIQAIIVGGNGTVREFAGIEKIRVLENISTTELDDLIMRARAVVVPLQDRKISIGQSVILQAMAMGKAVIATETAGTVDYIRNMETGILVPPGDIPAMKRALSLIDDPDLRQRLGKSARAQVASAHLPHHYSKNIRTAISVAAED